MKEPKYPKDSKPEIELEDTQIQNKSAFEIDIDQESEGLI